MLRVQRLSDILSGPRPQPPEAIVSGGFLDMEGSRLMISGQAKVGKSYWTLGLLRAIAAGTAFCVWTVPQSRVCLYYQMEVGPTWTDIRAWDLGQGMTMEQAYNLLYVTDREFERGHMGELAEVCLQEGVEVLAVDPLYMIHGGDENTSQEMKPILKMLDQLPVAAKIIIQHQGKDSSRGARGTSTFNDWPDTIVNLSGSPEALLVEVRQRNGGRPPDPFTVRLTGAPVRWEIKPDQADEDMVAILALLPAKAGDIERKLSWSQSKTYRTLANLRDQGVIANTRGLWLPTP